MPIHIREQSTLLTGGAGDDLRTVAFSRPEVMEMT